MTDTWHTPKDLETKLAEWLRQARIRQNLTQADLAEKAGVALPTLRRFEQTGAIALERFVRLAYALGQTDSLWAALNAPPKPESMQALLNATKTERALKGRVRARGKKADG